MSYNYNPNAAAYHQENGPHHQQFYTPQQPANMNMNHQTNIPPSKGNHAAMQPTPHQQHQQQPPGFPPQYRMPPFQPNAIFNDPMVSSLAVQYGANLADQGKEYVSKNVIYMPMK
jgi:hypothetical protein